MKAVQAKAYGSASEVLAVVDNVDKPTLASSPAAGKGKLLLRVQACSLSPSDYRMLSGDAKLIKKPRGGFPYVPAGDVCGEVLDVGQGAPFSVGDTVIATWSVLGQGGLAQFCIVDANFAVHKPKAISVDEGAALANSAGQALQALRTAVVVPGNRVLIIGASGGVGTILTQLVKRAGASFVAAVSTADRLMQLLGADRVVNYHHESWHEIREFAETPFDVIIDCAEGKTAWRNATRKQAATGKSVLSSTGRFCAVVLNEWHIRVTSPLHMGSLLAPPFSKQLGNTLWPFGPRYKMFLGGVDKGTLQEAADLVANGELGVVLDNQCPFDFTTEGVRAAWELHESRHAHGKVVIHVAD